MDWKGTRVLITGGASFIGSHLVDALVARGAKARIVDNLSSGRIDNVHDHIERHRIEFVEGDLLNIGVAEQVMHDIEFVFHLAADHGGRGYVDSHQAACATNLALDGIVFQAARKAGVHKVVFASSGCVYPNYLQSDVTKELYLTENLVKPPYDADNMYGWAKLMGELSLQAFHRDWGLRAASCRYFTVYGPRGHENHAIIAMIARSFIDQDPFVVWGTGEQIRNWTHVSDIVEGTLLAAEKIDDGTAINLGTMERIRVIDAAREVLRYTGKECLKIELHPELPTGPFNRVADNRLAQLLLGWQPRVKFIDGLHATIDWYYAAKSQNEIAQILGHKLTQR
jgi:nucleoside-diphosphate-sugar epimerase